MRLSPCDGLIARNVTCGSRRTSIRLELSMWDALAAVGDREAVSLSHIVTVVAAFKAPSLTLTAAVRVFLVEYFRAATTEGGHLRAGHGRGALADLAERIGKAQLPPHVDTALERQNAVADRLDYGRQPRARLELAQDVAHVKIDRVP